MSPSRPVRVLAAISLTLTPVLAAAGQSSFAVSPFVSYIPSAATNPLAGFALTFGGTTGLALRSGAEMSISSPRLDSAAAQAGGIRPWAADADAMLFLGGLGGGATVFRRSLSPYVFAGIGLSGADSAGRNVTQNGWSYGAGALIPLGTHADIFAEARWRMSQYVLPTSQGAPDSKSAMRFGLSFHVGGGSSEPRDYDRRRRNRMEAAEREDDDVYVVSPAPAQQPVVVVTPAPAEPQVVIVEQQPPLPEPVVVERESAPATTVISQRTRTRTTIGSRTTTSRGTIRMPGTRGTSRVLSRGLPRARTQPAPTDASSRVRRSTSSAGSATKVLSRSQTRIKTGTRSSSAVSRIKRGTASSADRQPR